MSDGIDQKGLVGQAEKKEHAGETQLPAPRMLSRSVSG